jgi:divalent metal cation (Fe/Co/Zn/Cd) transporter
VDDVNLRKLAVALLAVTLLYNVIEGVIAIASGVQAGSLVLISFGADSYLEVLATGAVLWRLSYRDEEEGERAEQRAMRFIGVTFLVLAAAIVFQATVSLTNHDAANESILGLLILTASLVVMPPLSFAKFWVAARTGMPVLAAEAKETIACSYLSLTAFAGVIAIFLFGWWWLDAVAALLMVPWLAREGFEGVRAAACFDGIRPCFCRTCFYGLRDCQPTCALRLAGGYALLLRSGQIGHDCRP